MRSNLDLARLLLRKVESDLADVRRTIASEGPYDTALFHCQQAVEKSFKALLAAHDITYPKTHDVAYLAERCECLCPGLHNLPFDLAELNPFAVTIRYDEPDEPISRDFAQEILNKTIQVLAVVTAALPEKIRP